jgi:hypothetical protein
MKTFFFIPLADHPIDPARLESLDSLAHAAVSVASLVWAMQRLAELAGALAAVTFYLSMLESDPIYLGLFPTLAYLGYGLYLTRKELKTTPMPPGVLVRGWAIISLLSWPLHRCLVDFRAKVIRADERYPMEVIDKDWMRRTLFFLAWRWWSIWSLTFFLPFGIGLFIEQGGLLS